MNKKTNQRTNIAIVKDIAGRRFLLGKERKKRSRKYHQKMMTASPINLTALTETK